MQSLSGSDLDEELVGRTEELRRLLARAETVAAGGGLVTITGPTGIGKSRLTLAFLAALRARHDGSGASAPRSTEPAATARPSVTVLTGSCEPGAAPMSAWDDLVRQAGGLLGLAPPAPSAAPDVARATDRVLSALALLPGSIIVTLDDLQHMGDASRLVLRQLVPRLPEHPVLLVGTIRRPSGAVRSEVPLPMAELEVALPALSGQDLVELIQRSDPALDAEALESRATQLLESTGGVPLLAITELVGSRRSDGWSRDALQAAVSSLDPDMRRTLEIVALAPNLEESALARHARIAPASLRAAFKAADQAGLLATRITDTQRRLHQSALEHLEDRMDPQARQETRLALGRSMRQDPLIDRSQVAHLLLAVEDLLGPGEYVAVAGEAAAEATSRLDHLTAEQFLHAAADALDRDPDSTDAQRLPILLRWARACRMRGEFPAAAHHSLRAARLARTLGEADALAEAAVIQAFPFDWREWSEQTVTLLSEADAAGPSPRWHALVLAHRAVIEMRVPIARDDDEAWAWATRPSTSRPLARRAVEIGRDSRDPEALAWALLAWRSVHRAPRFHEVRKSAGREALVIAGRLGEQTLHFEAALRHGLDLIEAGDRNGFEEQLATLAWLARRGDETRLDWRVACLNAVGAAYDGDLDGMDRYRNEASALAQGEQFKGRGIAEAMLATYTLMERGAHAALLASMERDHPALRHQVTTAIAARVVAEAGWSERARLLLDQLRSAELDEESSYLLTLAQAGLAAVTLGDATHAQWIVELLLPWRELVAVDSEGMWPALPVAMVTRDLHTALGDAARAREDHAIGRRVATRLRSAPAIQRLHTDGLAAPLERSAAAAASGPRSRSAHAPAVGVATSGGVRLDARQIGILNRLAEGATNEAIADELHVSRATAVRQISAIYRALGASNRAEAARRAAELGLLATSA